ncbi:MAG: hypothetical protein HQM08_01575 [Candidatus Riflebacteria bacterium]|nr:hypothetical protein [Candidatus Riflebacteria bacterium]
MLFSGVKFTWTEKAGKKGFFLASGHNKRAFSLGNFGLNRSLILRAIITLSLLFFLPACSLAATSEPIRFTRATNGTITNSSTQLQWLEGPDKSTNWNEAQSWIKSLGNGWRTPNREELRWLFIPNSTRKCDSFNTNSKSIFLRLDHVFHLDKAYVVIAAIELIISRSVSRELFRGFFRDIFQLSFRSSMKNMVSYGSLTMWPGAGVIPIPKNTCITPRTLI